MRRHRWIFWHWSDTGASCMGHPHLLRRRGNLGVHHCSIVIPKGWSWVINFSSNCPYSKRKATKEWKDMNKEKEVEGISAGRTSRRRKDQVWDRRRNGNSWQGPRERLEKPLGQRNRKDRRPDDRPQERKGFHTLRKISQKALSGAVPGSAFLCYT